MYVYLSNPPGSSFDWFATDTIYELDVFKEATINLSKYLTNKFLYSSMSKETRLKIEDEIDNFVQEYFDKVSIDITLKDLGEISTAFRSIKIMYNTSLAGSVFFSTNPEEYWDEFVKACKSKDKGTLLKVETDVEVSVDEDNN